MDNFSREYTRFRHWFLSSQDMVIYRPRGVLLRGGSYGGKYPLSFVKVLSGTYIYYIGPWYCSLQAMTISWRFFSKWNENIMIIWTMQKELLKIVNWNFILSGWFRLQTATHVYTSHRSEVIQYEKELSKIANWNFISYWWFRLRVDTAPVYTSHQNGVTQYDYVSLRQMTADVAIAGSILLIIMIYWFIFRPLVATNVSSNMEKIPRDSRRAKSVKITTNLEKGVVSMSITHTSPK